MSSKASNANNKSKKKVSVSEASSNKRKRSKNEDDEDADGWDDPPIPKPPGQPVVSVVDMAHILHPLAFRRHTEWTKEEKSNLAAFMCNRGGIDASDKIAMAQAGLTAIFEFWFNEYVNLYETDAEFEKAIDPWQIVVIAKPADNVFLPVLNLANRHIGGVGNANAPNEPIQFQHGQNWILHIPSGKENAHRVVSFLQGQFVGQNIPFQAIVQDYRTSMKDA